MKYKIFIISHLRSDNVSNMESFLDLECTWIVGNGEKKSYEDAGAKNVIEGGGLTASRNLALELAFKEDALCIQLSDDIKKLEVLTFPHKEVKATTFKEVLDFAMSKIDSYKNCFLFGVAPVPNPFYLREAVKHNVFIIGDMLFVKPNPLRFDSELTLKEDYEYTAQHIKKYGIVTRFDCILAHFKHYGNKGGAVAVRNDELETASILRIMKRHPEMFRLNPRRKNEILMKRFRR